MVRVRFSYREDFWVGMLFFICYNLENKTQKTGAPNDRFISNNLLSYALTSILEFISAFFPFPENLRSSRLSENDSFPFFGTQNDIFNNPKTADNLPIQSVGCP